MNASNQLIILTGGPGSGKSTLIQALHSAGFHTITEAGRAIIQDQMLIGGTALPWLNPSAFAELMLTGNYSPISRAWNTQAQSFLIVVCPM